MNTLQEKQYNKLVRDKIPSIIREDGKQPKTRFIESDDELCNLLAKKLVEESQEYLENKQIEELADMLEIIYTILKIADISQSELEKIRLSKRKERGGFEDRIFLLSVLE